MSAPVVLQADETQPMRVKIWYIPQQIPPPTRMANVTRKPICSSFVLPVAAPEAPGPSGGSEPSMSWSCGGSEDPTEHDRTEFTDDW
eukprot:CAMPEP_0179441608 /NCGR_PEP_ID=MMETSP0799-20121207/25136_1 /TAXON_ID=46947 /ORGANISM="Geminigera cryophila, Strain CCMP2564" /LENGTH=86 /DNA_ID=CAMNT_0021225985 /DNA_START=496 /DNA_END=753 /DNA_ORIENTATION=+